MRILSPEQESVPFQLQFLGNKFIFFFLPPIPFLLFLLTIPTRNNSDEEVEYLVDFEPRYEGQFTINILNDCDEIVFSYDLANCLTVVFFFFFPFWWIFILIFWSQSFLKMSITSAAYAQQSRISFFGGIFLLCLILPQTFMHSFFLSFQR